MPLIRGLLAVVASALLVSPTFAAGSLCGTVRDASTALPVHGAGIHVFSTTGVYAGFQAVSDSVGAFCMLNVPVGTYDLQVRRDDYATTYVRGVVVEDVTGVEIGLPPLPGELFAPFPDPALHQVRLRFRLAQASPVRLDVVDTQGRRIKAWQGSSLAAGEHTIDWDLRDASGRSVPVGRYFVRMEVRGSLTTRAFARVR